MDNSISIQSIVYPFNIESINILMEVSQNVILSNLQYELNKFVPLQVF